MTTLWYISTAPMPVRPPQPCARPLSLQPPPAAIVGLVCAALLRKQLGIPSVRLFWGGELLGREGLIAAPRLKTLALLEITLELCRLQVATPALLQLICGCWVFTCMFRRPMLCLLSESFTASRLLPTDRVISLSPAVLAELMLLCCLAPMLSCSQSLMLS